jgi:hypothetical protein
VLTTSSALAIVQRVAFQLERGSIDPVSLSVVSMVRMIAD